VEAGLLDDGAELELDLSGLEELDDFSVDEDFSAGLSAGFSEEPDESPPPEPLTVLFAVSRLSLR
jgi:hypothetical protein